MDIVLIKVISDEGVGVVKGKTTINEEYLRSLTPMLAYWGTKCPNSGTLFVEIKLISREKKSS